MGEFNGKKFYGYNVDNDPELMAPTWSTKNFEFSCIRPETVQRAIDKVQSDVGASLKQRKSHLLSKLREKGGEAPVFKTQLNRDIDIETRMSHAHSEFDHMKLDKERAYGSENSCTSPHSFMGNYPRQISPFSIQSANQKRTDIATPPIATPPPPPPGFSPHVQNVQSSKPSYSTNLQRIAIEEYPTPKWVTIEETQLRTMQIFDVKELPFVPTQCRQHPQHHLPQPHIQHAYPYGMHPMSYPYLPPPPPPQILQAAGYAYNAPPMVGQIGYQDIYTDCDPRSYLVEDSDMDDEMLQRQHYTQYCQQRPKAEEMQASDENEGRPEFVKIAPKEPYTDMSYLKSTAPMRYSELSDEETLEEYKDQSPRVVIKKRADASGQGKPKQKKQKNATDKIKHRTLAQLIAEEKMLANNRNQIPKVHFKKPRKQIPSPTAQPQPKPAMPPQKAKTIPLARPKQVQIIASPRVIPNKAPIILSTGKSMEQLKTEKMGIFNKMSRTHERIVLALETLREKLLEVHEPESTSDRNRRNRNGFEFSVRFLRNFLYPLKGMIDTMRNTTKEQFNSASSNDACNRVAHIYSLFLQAILTYSKQLRHFMIDQVPQKLTTLLEMLYSTTNICLDKRLFDRNDPLVDCMLNHCKNFLHFMEDLHARRFVAARESYRKAAEAPESKFNLKMFMNDLNMYEPRLVPKKSSTIRIKASTYKPGFQVGTAGTAVKAGQPAVTQQARRKRAPKATAEMRRQRLEAGRLISDASDGTIHKRLEADIATQIQECAQTRSSELDYRQSREMMNLQKILQNNIELDKNEKIDVFNRAIVDALQSCEHGHTSDVLKPLLKTINAALDLPDNAEYIEKILKAFQMKIPKPMNKKKIVYEDKSEGYCLSRKASRTKQQQRSHTSINRNEDDINEQQHQHHRDDDQCSGEYSNEHDSSQSDYESPANEFDDDYDDRCEQYNDPDYYVSDEKDNDNSEEYDEDAQFYVSGEDCDNYNNNYKRNIILNGKKKLETLVEYANENVDIEADERSTSSNVFNKQMRRKSNQSKRSPYEARLYRKKSVQSITTPTVIPQTKKSAAAAAVAKSIRLNGPTAIQSKTKQTTTPPSPAMSRLKQRTQPLPIDRSKKSNLLKKHSRRNPMGSPPPVPTVSPSTSGPNTPSLNVSDMHLSLSNSAMSHKGVNTNNERNDDEEKKTQQFEAHVVNNNEEDDEDTFRAEKIEYTETSKNSLKKEIRTYSDGNVTPVVTLPLSDVGLCESKHTPLTLYTGTNPYEGTVSARPPSSPPSSSSNKSEQHCDSLEKSKKRVEFDESGLLLERDQHLSLCLRNPLYSNPKFSRPWKMFTRLSEKLTEEVLQAVQSDFANGVEAFVDDFLHLETTI